VIQESNESIAKLAKKYNINPKTAHRWKRDTSIEDKKSGLKTVRSSLSEMEQQIVCEFRRVTKLPLETLLLHSKIKFQDSQEVIFTDVCNAMVYLFYQKIKMNHKRRKNLKITK